MADRNRQAERKNSIPVQALVCLLAIAAPCGLRGRPRLPRALPRRAISANSIPISLGAPARGIAAVSFLVAIGIWILAALRGAKSAQLRRSAFISSALNTLNQGVMITNAQNRVVFCNDRFLEMYGLNRAEIRGSMTGRELLELRRTRGLLSITVDEFSKLARRPEGVVTELPDGRSVLSKLFRLPNGGTIGTHEDCTEQRQLSRKLASTTKFLESVLDNVPVCVAAKNIEDGRYIFANRAFERFSRFSRDHIVGKRADEIFRPETAKSIEMADAAALTAPEGHNRSEYFRRTGRRERVISSNRVVAPQREQRAGIPDQPVRRRHRPAVAVARARKHQEVPRTGGRQHPGVADRGARQRRDGICSPTAAPRPFSIAAARTPPA
jgi:PAS domain-containing protein